MAVRGSLGTIKRYAPERLHWPNAARDVSLAVTHTTENITRSVVEHIISEQAHHG